MKFSYFFIDRPIFASVLSILIVLIGGITAFLLPLAQYPDIVPPTVVVTASYPGADAQTIAETVAEPIEKQVNGVSGMLYMSSQSSNNGAMSLTVTFAQGTDPNIAQVLVQNQLASALPSLPAIVRQIGVTAQKTSPNFLLLVTLFSPGDIYDTEYLSNYAEIQIADVLKRLEGVGNIQLFGAGDYSMRVWLNPYRMADLKLTVEEVSQAIQSQNVQVAAGTIGAPPAPEGTQLQLTVTTLGRLTRPEQFSNIIVKTGSDGQIVRLRDIGSVILGSRNYSMTSYYDGKPGVALGVSVQPGANYVATSARVRNQMQELSHQFNPGLAYRIDYDTSQFVIESLKEVVYTLLIALLLVVVVVSVFLQSWRAAIIPLIAIPVSLVGTFAALYVLGFSLNSISLFGLVLAIGIVVDDAIVVVENCERHLKEGFSPKDAARKAMDEVGGPVVAIGVVLIAVFLPTAFLPGIPGQFYRQFGATVVVSTLISAFNSLTLSPALCAVLLRGEAQRNNPATGANTAVRFFRGLNRAFNSAANGYAKLVRRVLRFTVVALVLYAGLLVLTGLAFKFIPTGFVPTQDQGFIIVAAQLPDSASLQRTEAVRLKIEEALQQIPEIVHTIGFSGFSLLSGGQPNACTIFVLLKPFNERTGSRGSLSAILGAIRERTATIQEASVAAFPPPAIEGVGLIGGFQFELEDRGHLGLAELRAVADQLSSAANQLPTLRIFSNLRTEVPQLYVDLDRTKIERLGVPLTNVFNALQAYLGGNYVNDFNFLGRTFQVNIQAAADFRAQADQIERLLTLNRQNELVPFKSFATVRTITGPDRVIHYNLFTSADFFGSISPGISSGQAIDSIQAVCSRILPPQMSIEWTGLSYQEIRAGNTAIFAFTLSVLVVFLALAALYESWSLPLAVVLIVPTCLSAAITGVFLHGAENNIFTQIGFVILVGLASKNAILIVEFARKELESGKDRIDAVVEACRLRLRPILMTSFAFIFGVFPLVIASGAGAEIRQALGIAVFSGMIGVTLFGLLLTPVFFVVLSRRSKRKEAPGRKVETVPSGSLGD